MAPPCPQTASSPAPLPCCRPPGPMPSWPGPVPSWPGPMPSWPALYRAARVKAAPFLRDSCLLHACFIRAAALDTVFGTAALGTAFGTVFGTVFGTWLGAALYGKASPPLMTAQRHHLRPAAVQTVRLA